MREALDIQVHGVVQGVGFRPFVYKLARRHLISGWVLNATAGVFIHAEGESRDVDDFVLEISDNAPAASRVDEILMKEVPLEGFDTFEIRYSSDAAAEATTLVSPDLAICDECAAELFDPANRRYHYPFINCTNCGPRFTIIDELPYDRAKTSMRAFPMCDACSAEYGNPEDRRFHAQPDACFECGPHVSWRLAASESAADETAGTQNTSEAGQPGESAADAGADTPAGIRWGATREESDAIFAEAAALLQAGGIVAVKGLGGFHLACDANNPEALAELRRRKHREGKAFAVMMPSLDAARAVCHVGEAEEKLLCGSVRPIVLLKKRAGAHFAAGLADNLGELGVMLPYTPVQHLLIAAFGGPLVMTSGNVHNEPIQTNDEEAFAALSGIADAFLGNNRPIRCRFDDSVVRVIAAGSAGEAVQMVRRARGYAPMPIPLKTSSAATEDMPAKGTQAEGVRAGGAAIGGAAAQAETSAVQPNASEHPAAKPAQNTVFACGPEQKNTFCLLRGEEAFVSPHVGDMENAATFDAWLASKAHHERLFDTRPAALVADAHPEYLTTKWAHEAAEREGLPLEIAQHHHAHIVSVMAENNLEDAVIGVAFDGTGYGADGCIWGGEVLLANRQDFERFANFAYVPMPGGAAAVKNPLRMAYGALWEFGLLEHPAAVRALAGLGEAAAVCDQMIERGLNCPMTSSVGRLFDAASALLGICTQPAYEGEAAILLEAAMYDEGAAEAGAQAQAGNGGSAGAEPNAAGAGDEANLSETAATSGTGAGATADTGAGNEAASSGTASAGEPYQIALTKNSATATSTAHDTSVVLFDAQPLFAAMLDDMERGVPAAIVSRKIHDAFVQAIVQVCLVANAAYGISTVALAGGVFMNRYLVEHSVAALEQAGFTVALNVDLPPNDGGVSYGQAAIATARRSTKATAQASDARAAAGPTNPAPTTQPH